FFYKKKTTKIIKLCAQDFSVVILSIILPYATLMRGGGRGEILCDSICFYLKHLAKQKLHLHESSDVVQTISQVLSTQLRNHDI
ncbi:Equisetin cluster transcription factor eqxF, partial [Frankliniella fusca]